ncbi:hypothetical protein [Catellatospora paridis]|uniref:hypothetical protein n=1 Tax=Catellatospora paridis TaxID=1617086 RepID=UPI0012D3DCD1|nr:hypothetical protein [Catellatospora paridis]
MWRLWYALGVVLVGFGLLIGAVAVYGYTQLDGELAHAEQKLSEAEGEEDLRFRQVQVADIEDGKSNNVLFAVGSLVPVAGGVGLVALGHRGRRSRRVPA